MKIYIAPMSGFTDYSYRKILEKFSPSLLFAEMVNSHLIKIGDTKTINLLKCDNFDNIGIQVFGNNSEDIIYSFLKLEDMGFKNINLNMGCPQPKIIKSGSGAALLPDIDFIKNLICELKEKVNFNTKISIKIRLGYKKFNSPEIYVKMADDFNLDFICVHGRTQEQFYNGFSDWDKISNLSKINRNINFIGNGDLFSAEDIKNKIKFSNLDGIMLARGIIGNPWLITQTKEILNYGVVKTNPNFYDIKSTLIEHFNLLIENKGKITASLEINKFIKPYFKNLKYHNLNDKLNEIIVEKDANKKMKELSHI